MAQRFIDGISLDARLKRNDVLDLATTVSIATDVAGGLEALWAAGRAHGLAPVGREAVALLHERGVDVAERVARA